MNSTHKTRLTNAKRHLAAGILAQARRDLRRFSRATRALERELYRDARDWVVSDSCRWPFSFRNVCEKLNLVPEDVRRELFAEVSLGALPYWSRRFGRGVRRVQASLNETLVKARSTGINDLRSLVHAHP